jgi:hypothetical protein
LRRQEPAKLVHPQGHAHPARLFEVARSLPRARPVERHAKKTLLARARLNRSIGVNFELRRLSLRERFAPHLIALLRRSRPHESLLDEFEQLGRYDEPIPANHFSKP